jgi:two-component system chemotaxis sensor kinase CheA
MMKHHEDIFREEAYELLTELEEGLLELEDSPEDRDAVGRVFRALHTIKGSGAMFGFDDIAGLAHEVETVFDLVRNGQIPVTRELIDLTLGSKDCIRELLNASDTGEKTDRDSSRLLVQGLRALMPEETGEDTSQADEEPTLAEPESTMECTYRIRFRPGRDIYVRGTDPVTILNELKALGRCVIVSHLHEIPGLEDFDSEACYTYWDVILTTNRGMNAIRDVFIFLEEDAETSVELIDEGGFAPDEEAYKRLGEILVERGDISTEALHSVLVEQQPLGKMLVERGMVNASTLESALLEQQVVRESMTERKTRESLSSVRVPAGKLDTLVDLVGELVTMQARLAQASSSNPDPELAYISEEIEGLTAELHDNAMSLRMVPIGTVFSTFKRLVRDLSNGLGREVSFLTSGAGTELDKTVIERLKDPLVHLIRNCIGHGIEPPAERERAGKPGTGTVRLSAQHSGSYVIIEVRDDGKGLDEAAIHQRAVELGLVKPDTSPGEQEIQQFIFSAGFSTAETVTGVSGRGVGMDVVRRNIESLRGSIDVQSRKGLGTRITLKIPLTLAIIDGLLVKIEAEHFVFPLSIVEECIELTHEDVKAAHGRNIVNLREEVLPYIRLREQFQVEGEEPPIQQVVVTDTESQRVGFVVDTVVGEHQTVIKPLGRAYRNVQGISGATILGDGTVALILDAPKLFRMAEKHEGEHTALAHGNGAD